MCVMWATSATFSSPELYQVGHDIVVREHNALGQTRRSTRERQDGDVIHRVDVNVLGERAAVVA